MLGSMPNPSSRGSSFSSLSSASSGTLCSPLSEEVIQGMKNIGHQIEDGQNECVFGDRESDPIIDFVMTFAEGTWEDAQLWVTDPKARTATNLSPLQAKLRKAAFWSKSRDDAAVAKLKGARDGIKIQSSLLTETSSRRRQHLYLTAIALHGILPGADTVGINSHTSSISPIASLKQQPATDGDKYRSVYRNNLFSESGPVLVRVAKHIHNIYEFTCDPRVGKAVFESKKLAPISEIVGQAENLIIEIARNMRRYPRDSVNHVDQLTQLEIGVMALNSGLSDMMSQTYFRKYNKSLLELRLQSWKDFFEERADGLRYLEFRQAQEQTVDQWLDPGEDYDPDDVQQDNVMWEGTSEQKQYRIESLLPRLEDLELCHISTPPSIRDGPVAGGGFGEIYKAVLPNTNDEVAVKMIKVEADSNGENHPEWRVCLRILREARIWAKTRHENVIPFLGFWTSFLERNPYPALISPWCVDGNLLKYVKGKCVRKRLTLTTQAAKGLEYLHNCDPEIVHGDVRAVNVLIYEGRACLCDFGISKIMDDVRGETTEVHGNDRWKAPELLEANRINGTPVPRPTTRSDIFMMGCVFLEALTGEKPYFGLSDTGVAHARTKNTTRVPALPNKIIEDKYYALMDQCWKFDPDKRPEIRKVVHDLEEFRNTAPKTDSCQCCT